MVKPVLTGYYRYTDIWFEWFQAIPGDDRFAVKAAFAHDALVHPDHPLHKEGVDGIEMYMGTLQNGESRLLFSSKQVDYIRYWLKAMKITKDFVPLPYSERLLTASDLRIVSPVVYKDGGSLRNAIKQIDKSNKRLKGSNPLLHGRRDTFERVRTLWAQKQGVWCALDIESWDRDHKLITEFGWSLVRWENGHEIAEQGHLIAKEYRSYTNTYVANNKERYNFGTSQVVNKPTFKSKIHDLVSRQSRGGPLFLVFHDGNQDMKYLQSKDIDAPLGALTHQLPDTPPAEGIFFVDTADLFAALEGEGGSNRRGLERICRHLQIQTEHLHNAGNDAHYTLLAMKAMASGDPVDHQREKRWPNHTGMTTSTGPKVQFQPWEEDSDYSDQEGLAPCEEAFDVDGAVNAGVEG